MQKQSLQHVGQIQFQAIFLNNLLNMKIAVEARRKGDDYPPSLQNWDKISIFWTTTEIFEKNKNFWAATKNIWAKQSFLRTENVLRFEVKLLFFSSPFILILEFATKMEELNTVSK